MKFKILTKDLLNILSSTKQIVDKLKFIEFDFLKIDELANHIKNKVDEGFEDLNTHFGISENYEQNVQLIFIENVVNFCFWDEKDKGKWKIEWNNKKINGGWYGLKTCFQRALADNVPILDANYLSSISEENVKALFKSSNGIEIPLIEKRMKNLQEAGRILIDEYQGNFLNVINKSDENAVSLTKLIYKDFPSFKDIYNFEGQKVCFLKRAQICANDINYVYQKKYGKSLAGVEELTAFADYRLPQMLRMFGVINYSDNLAKKVDNYILLPFESREEIEIRAVTVWGIELIRQKLKFYTAAQIDNALWLMSQGLPDEVNPYHRTYTTYY